MVQCNSLVQCSATVWYSAVVWWSATVWLPHSNLKNIAILKKKSDMKNYNLNREIYEVKLLSIRVSEHYKNQNNLTKRTVIDTEQSAKQTNKENIKFLGKEQSNQKKRNI